MTSDTGASTAALAGWRVLVPRNPERAGALLAALTAAGAHPVAVPLIAIEPPAEPGALDLRLIDLAGGAFAWVGFTSVNAIDAALSRAAALGLHPAVPADTRIAAVGPATAAALRRAGLPVDLVPTTAGSGAALAALWPTAIGDQAVLLPRSDLAAPGLPQALADKGYRVAEVTAYRTVPCPPTNEVAADLATGRFDAVLFTSPSTVAALAGIDIAAGTVLAAIGRPTAAAAEAAGRRVDVMAAHPTPQALVDGLIAVSATTRSAAARSHPRRVEA